MILRGDRYTLRMPVCPNAASVGCGDNGTDIARAGAFGRVAAAGAVGGSRPSRSGARALSAAPPGWPGASRRRLSVLALAGCCHHSAGRRPGSSSNKHSTFG